MKTELLTILLLLLFAVQAFAADAPRRQVINLANRRPNLPFSDAVMVGDTLYLSGRIGIDPKTNLPPAGIEQEARLLLDGFKAVLAEAGMTMDDLVSVQVCCPDVSLFDRWNAVYKTYFKGDLPARAFLGSGPLLFGAHFEMMGIAVKTKAKGKK
ncbi:MAG TPA: RidA family protein [Terriglobales bacterium]|nr:RidA family protein [Terriglobales bacterium]